MIFPLNEERLNHLTQEDVWRYMYRANTIAMCLPCLEGSCFSPYCVRSLPDVV